MPAGDQGVQKSFDIEWLDSVGSTNEVAMRRANGGATGPLWIAAREQTGGRGRGGRQWASPPGNLYASLLLTLDRPVMVIAQLALVAGVAVHSAVLRLGPQLPLALKWPNDVLVDGAKLSGILIESQPASVVHTHNVVVGIGINLAHHPVLTDRPATSLAASGISASPGQALQYLADAFAEWLAVWSAGDGFADIRQAWQQRAVGLGSEVSVKTGRDVVSGRFQGLDADGAMLLQLASGEARRITFGDVHIGVRNPADT